MSLYYPTARTILMCPCNYASDVVIKCAEFMIHFHFEDSQYTHICLSSLNLFKSSLLSIWLSNIEALPDCKCWMLLTMTHFWSVIIGGSLNQEPLALLLRIIKCNRYCLLSDVKYKRRNNILYSFVCQILCKITASQ